MTVPVVFIRDDDVDRVDPVLREIFECLEESRVPVIYGVIPGKLKNDLVNFFLRKKKAGVPFDIVQHGFRHCNYSEGPNKYEFGSVRTFEAQYRDILAGGNIMKTAFGRHFTPAFVPPYHGFDQKTVKVVGELAIPVFSAGRKVTARQKNFLDLPARISLNDYGNDGRPLPLGFKPMLKRVLSRLRPDVLNGMVYHHSALRTQDEVAAMKMFLRALGRLRDEKKVKIVLFSDFLEARWGLSWFAGKERKRALR